MTMAVVTGSFCRACGADQPDEVASCPRCGWTTAPMPTEAGGPIGDVHRIRRGLRRKRAVRTGDDGTEAHLLLESGEDLAVSLSDLPAPADPVVPWSSVVRSAPGRLLEIAAAVVRDQRVAKWDPDALRAAAVNAASDQESVRLLALDALALDMEDILPQLSLTTSERVWLMAVRCAQRGDAARFLHHIAALPPEGYAPKVGLVLDLASIIRGEDLDIAVLERQLRPFVDRDPCAAVLLRAFELSNTDASTAAADARWLAARLDMGCPERAAIEWGIAQVLDDQELEVAAGDADAQLVDPPVRALAALRHPGSAYLAPGDVATLADSVADDLIHAGSLDAATALGAPRDAQTRLYLTARLAPEQLTDEEVRELHHDDERARRTFPLADPAELEQLTDSSWMRHFRSLALIRLHRSEEVKLDHVRHGDGANVEALIAAVYAAADGQPVVDRLTNSLLNDPTVWPVLTALVGSTTLQPSSDLASQFPVFCEWLALHHAREYLYQGDWSAAVAAADRCLALATGERVRDEALNLKACGLYHQGDGIAAIAALEEAIEGAYSAALLANIGVVAAGLKPEVAARHLGKLMVEAPNVAQRVAAGRRVVQIWLASGPGAFNTSGTEALPAVVRDPLRVLVTDDIGIEDFRGIAKLLAQHDGAWFAHSSRLEHSPHSDTLDARVYQALARSLEDLVETIGAAIKAGDLPEWLESERRKLRDDTAEFVIENIDDESLSIGALPIAMFEQGVLLTAYDRVFFPAMGLASLALHMTQQVKDELDEQFVAMTFAMRERWQELPGDDQERVAPMVGLATNRVAANRGIGRTTLLNEAADLYNSTTRMIQAGNHIGARHKVEAAHRAAMAVAEEIENWLRVVEGAEIRKALRDTLSDAHELDALCSRLGAVLRNI